LAIGAAVAQEQDIVRIPLDTVMYGKPGAVKLIDPPGVVNVPADKVGSQCSVHETSENNRSTHPNTDLIVTSGGSSVTLFDVEREGGGRVDGDGLLTLGETVSISVRFGADGVFSGGFLVGLCETVFQPPPLPPPVCNAEITISVAPETQVVEDGQDADFVLSVSNTGDEDLVNVAIDSSIDSCDISIGELEAGEETSNTCKAERVAADLDITFAVTGAAATCEAEAVGTARSTVGFVLPVPVAVVPPRPPAQLPPVTPVPSTPRLQLQPVTPVPPTPRLPSLRVTTTTTLTIPSGVPTGAGDGATHRVPVGVLAVTGLGIAAIAAGTYRVARREQ
jgi:hypothetical protein